VPFLTDVNIAFDPERSSKDGCPLHLSHRREPFTHAALNTWGLIAAKGYAAPVGGIARSKYPTLCEMLLGEIRPLRNILSRRNILLFEMRPLHMVL